MKSSHNKAKLQQKSDNDSKIEDVLDVLPFPHFLTLHDNFC